MFLNNVYLAQRKLQSSCRLVVNNINKKFHQNRGSLLLGEGRVAGESYYFERSFKIIC